MASNSLLSFSRSPGMKHYSTYYSGMCARIYFGDLWIDEIVEIEWSLQENVAPIFGYASYTWDKVARGNRFVTGSFVINYKEVGYLQTVLNSLSSEMTDESEWFSLTEFDGSKEVKAHKNLSVEQVIENFDDLANDFEDALWGKESDSSGLVDSRRTDTFFYGDHSNTKNTPMKEHGYNILITYGNADLGAGSKSCAPKGSELYGSGVSDTAQTLVGVQLTGVSQRIDPSGNPIQEVYTFIAKDISGNVQKPY